MISFTECGDDVLVGYDCRAVFPDGTTDTSTIFEPPARVPDAPRAIHKYIGWRLLYVRFGATVSFEARWLPRHEAIAQGFITGIE